MRRLALLTAPILATAWLLACEDDPNSGGGTILLPDGGGGYDANSPGYDANVPPPDATADAPVGPLPVTVVVADVTGAAVQGVTVVFHDANGAVLETKTTDAQGKVLSGTAPIPAMVTVAFPHEAADSDLLTWTNVQGGDVLPVVAPVSNTLAQVAITVPGQFDGNGGPTTNYYVKVGRCEQYAGDVVDPITLYLDRNCYTGAGAALVVGSNSNDDVVAYSFKKPIMAPTDGGALAVTTEAWTAPPTDVTISIANTVDTSAEAVLTPIANDTAFGEDVAGLGDVYAYTFKAPPAAFADAYNASVRFSEFSKSRVIGKRLAPTGTIALDANDLPVAITDATVDSTVVERPVANWTGNMSAMKGGVLRLYWFDNQNDRQTRWSIVVPPNAAATGSVKAPALPAALMNILPSAEGGGSVWLEVPDVYFVDSDLLPDYAGWKKIQGALFRFPALQNIGGGQIVLPQNGTFKVTNYHPNFG